MMRRRSWIIWLLALGGWVLIGLSFSINDYAFRGMLRRYYEGPLSLPSVVFWDLVYWPTWAALTPITLWIARRFPLSRRWQPNLAINLAALAFLPFTQRIIYLLIAWPLQQRFGQTTSFKTLILYNLPMGFMICSVILFVSHLINHFREEELRASRLEAGLMQAQLAALKMQLQPHFLFNTLSYISAQLDKDVKAADEMLSRLGHFLGRTLENSGAEFISLEEELEQFRLYLDIVNVRLKDRLQVRYDFEPQLLYARVPNLILQPIIENAIKHGVEQSFGEVQIVIVAKQERDKLLLQVKDNGECGPVNDESSRKGFGINNTRKRLKTAYGDDARFDLTRGNDGWTVAALKVPLITETTDAGGKISQKWPIGFAPS